MMKKIIFKQMAFAACGILALTACTKDKDYYDPNYYKQLFSSNFVEQLMGGQSIDPAQTWNTSVGIHVEITPDANGTVCIYTASPLGNNVAALCMASVKAGKTFEATVACPQNTQQLFVTLYDGDGYVVERSVPIVNNEAIVNFQITSSGSAAPHKVVTRAIPSVFNFSAAAPRANAGDFLAAVPDGVSFLAQNAATCNAFIDETFQGELNIWGGWDAAAGKNVGGTLYVKGNCDFSNRKFYMAGNSKIYLLEGATLTLSAENASNLQGGCQFFVASNATMRTAGELKLNNGLRISSRGTIEAARLSVNNTSVLYNEGVVTVTGDLSVENNHSVIVNDGTITAARLHTAGSGHVQNNGDMTISGNTDIDSNNNTWVNNGQYRTGNFVYTAGSCDVINNCKLTVDELFHINLGDTDRNGFQNDADAGVVTKNFLAAGPSYIYLGQRSVFRVLETATMNITKDVYGIYGPSTGDYAVFEAETIAHGDCDANQGFVANYFNHLVVATNSHFPNGYSDKSAAQQANGEVGSQPYYRLDAASGAKMASAKNGATDINIPATTCNPGYAPGSSAAAVDGGSVAAAQPRMYYFYAFEDLGTTDDFDFNDVILGVTAPVNGVSDIYLMAAGGTMATSVRLGGEVICEEVHAALGSNISDMINTTFVNRPFVKIGETETSDPSELPLSIVVTKTDGSSMEVAGPAAGEAPLMIRVAGNTVGKWFWPSERRGIDIAYPGFGAWGASYANGGGWDKNATPKTIVNY